MSGAPPNAERVAAEPEAGPGPPAATAAHGACDASHGATDALHGATDGSYAATDASHGACDALHGAPDALRERLREEVNRARRHGTALCCLLVEVEDAGELGRAHGALLAEQALAYVELAVRCELRSFDRVARAGAQELLVVLPGADGARGELVARRLLHRLRAVKLEAAGARRPLRLAIGVASWREQMGVAALLAALRAAAGHPPGPDGAPAELGGPAGPGGLGL